MYTEPKIDYKTRRKSVVVPDQSLSIKEIVSRYVRGVPADVIRREAVYVDQNDFDLEKLSRMDFAEKAEIASQLKTEAERITSEYNERVTTAKEEQAKKESEENAKAEDKKTESKGSAGPDKDRKA